MFFKFIMGVVRFMLKVTYCINFTDNNVEQTPQKLAIDKNHTKAPTHTIQNQGY